MSGTKRSPRPKLMDVLRTLVLICCVVIGIGQKLQIEQDNHVAQASQWVSAARQLSDTGLPLNPSTCLSVSIRQYRRFGYNLLQYINLLRLLTICTGVGFVEPIQSPGFNWPKQITTVVGGQFSTSQQDILDTACQSVQFHDELLNFNNISERLTNCMVTEEDLQTTQVRDLHNLVHSVLKLDPEALTLDLRDTLVAHLRGGGSVQLPCSFYAEAFKHSGQSHLLIVAEDRRHPCLHVLADKFANARIVVGGSAIFALTVFMRARHVIVARSVFSNAAVAFSSADRKVVYSLEFPDVITYERTQYWCIGHTDTQQLTPWRASREQLKILQTLPSEVVGCFPASNRSEVVRMQAYFETNKDGRILVGVNYNAQTLDRMESISMTWGKYLPVVFLVCEDFVLKNPRLVGVPGMPCEENPSAISWAHTLQYVAQTRSTRLKWFLNCNDDTYVNSRALWHFIDDIERRGIHSSQPHFAGAVGSCMMLSIAAVRQLSTILPDCMMTPAPLAHGDVQLAHCLRALNTSFGFPTLGFSGAEMDRLFKHYAGNMQSSKNGNSIKVFEGSTVPDVLPRNNVPLTVQSIKDRSLMLRVHGQLHFGAHPIRRDNRTSGCYHNPLMYKMMTTCKGLGFSPYWTDADQVTIRSSVLHDSCSREAKECSIHPLQSGTTRRGVMAFDMSYIIALDTTAPNVQQLRARLRSFGLKTRVVQAVNGVKAKLSSAYLSPGELGLRQSFKNVFQDAIDAQYKTVAVFEEDALIHRDFDQRLEELMACPRCSCHLVTETGCTPGGLLLGTTIHDNAQYVALVEDAKRFATPCANYADRMFGMFAVAYNVDVLPHLVHWMDRQSRFPADWGFTYLAQEGFVTRVAYPFLAIADIAHKSTVKKRPHEGDPDALNKRLKLHRWNISEFQ